MLDEVAGSFSLLQIVIIELNILTWVFKLLFCFVLVIRHGSIQVIPEQHGRRRYDELLAGL